MRLLLFFLVFGLSVYSQDEGDSTVYHHEKSIMIIPFEPKLYNSQIDKDLSAESGKDYNSLVSAFTYGTAFQFKYELLYRYKAFTTINAIEDSVKKDLSLIYANIGYEYKVLKDSTTAEENKSLAKKFKNIQSSTQKTGTYMQNGEIVSHKDERQKFMSTVLRSDTLLPYLNYRYQASYYLFINQIDLINDLSDANKVALGEYDRIVRLHFTILDQDGKIVEEGILERHFSKDINDPEVIINEYIKSCAKDLRKKLGKHEINQEEVKPTKSVVPLKKLKK